MTKEELIKRLQDIEWEDFEAKEAAWTLPKNIWDTVSAFSNTAGGWIVLGAKQSGKKFEIVGVSDPEKIEQDFTTTLRSDKFNVKITCASKKYNFDDKILILFYIPISDKKPVYYGSLANTFIRSASGDQRATKEEVDSMYRDQSFGIHNEKCVKGSEASWIHKKSVSDYKSFMKSFNPQHPYNKLSGSELLKKLRVVVDGEVTYGGLLFFGKSDYIANIITDFRIDYLEVPGTSYSDAKTRYTYRLQECENVWQYYFAIFDRLLRQVDIPFKMGEFFAGDTNYPFLIALREALVNMLQHTDYFSPMKSRIRVFYDHIEFLNPGGLPLPLEKLINSDISLPRNKIIAKLFRVVNLSENGGYGFEKMNNGWKSYNGTSPEYLPDPSFFKVTFNTMKKGDLIPGLDFTERIGEKQGTDGGQIGDRESESRGQRLSKQGTDNSEQSVKLTENQQIVLSLIMENPSVSRREIAGIMNIKEGIVIKHLEALKRKKVIERIGGDFGGQWKILIEPDKINSK